MKLPNNLRPLAALALALAVAGTTASPARADTPRAEETAAKMAEARAALNATRYKEAADLYAEAVALAEKQEQAEAGALAGDALYWQAFARYRLQQTGELKHALKLLQIQQQEYQSAATAAEGAALAMTIAGELAERGEASAAREVYEAVEQERQREDTRIAALHALMQMNPEKARPILAKIVKGETEASLELRHNAVFVLCREDPAGTEIVLEALPTTTEPALLQAMVLCLAEDGSERSLDALVELMRRSDDPEVVQTIMIALGHHEDERAFTMLAEIARDRSRDSELRAHAMVGLAQTEDERAVDIALEIVNAEGEPDEVVEMALLTLVNSGSERAGDALLSLVENPQVNDDLRAMALFNAGTHGQIDVDRLRSIYANSDSRQLKIQICHLLAQMDGQEEALDLMLEIVKTEQDPEIRQNAVFWIGQFDDPRAAEALLEIIASE